MTQRPTIDEPRIVALLPMKGHSERVTAKNFRRLGGRPLFRWILDKLLEVADVGEVVVNTDARDLLAEHGLDDGDRVRIRDRRQEICGDLVSMNLVIADDVENVQADTFLMTHTTNPFLSAETIRSALVAYREGVDAGTCDSLFTVNRIQTRFYRADGSPVNHDPANLIRTQDLEPWFEENSCLYIFSAASFVACRARIGRQPRLFEIPAHEAIDIDTPQDWQLASVLAEAGFPSRVP